jgi:hypothetical protein
MRSTERGDFRPLLSSSEHGKCSSTITKFVGGLYGKLTDTIVR